LNFVAKKKGPTIPVWGGGKQVGGDKTFQENGTSEGSKQTENRCPAWDTAQGGERGVKKVDGVLEGAKRKQTCGGRKTLPPRQIPNLARITNVPRKKAVDGGCKKPATVRQNKTKSPRIYCSPVPNIQKGVNDVHGETRIDGKRDRRPSSGGGTPALEWMRVRAIIRQIPSRSEGNKKDVGGKRRNGSAKEGGPTIKRGMRVG